LKVTAEMAKVQSRGVEMNISASEGIEPALATEPSVSLRSIELSREH